MAEMARAAAAVRARPPWGCGRAAFFRYSLARESSARRVPPLIPPPRPSWSSATMATHNASFADFVKDAREKKRNEVLAQQFLGSRGRKVNAAGSGAAALNGRANSQKPTLLSRMSGVQKQRSSSAKPAATIDGKWQHDLHKLNNPSGPPRKGLNRTVSTSHIDRNKRNFDKFASALNRDSFGLNGDVGLSIRGAATSGGPHTVIASNFASGTTAADIEQVMGQVGGELLECRIVVAKPTVMAELTFGTKEGAENVIATFNGKKVGAEKTTDTVRPC